MKKKVTLYALVFCLVVNMNIFLFSSNVQAAGKYSSSSALSYASGHWNDGVGLCAEFVSNCLKAGGCSAYSASASALFRQLQSSGIYGCCIR